MGEAYRYLTASGNVSNRPVRILRVIVTPDGTNASYLDLFDGNNTNAPKIARLRVSTTQSGNFDFATGLKTLRGLYADFGSNLSSATIVLSDEVEG
jgi:hypothetical protein